MAKADSIQRLILVAHRINACPYITIEELAEWLSEELGKNSYACACSPNTLKRDIKSLREDFLIDVKYSRANGGYYIDKSDDGCNPSLSLVETFDTLSALGVNGSVPSYIYLEPFKPRGTHHLRTIINAIDTRSAIDFCYHKYSNNANSNRTISPSAVKQMRGRWYLIGCDDRGVVKTFGLDRIEELKISSSDYREVKNFSIEDKFRDSYGIYSDDSCPVEEVVLSFDCEDGAYLKSLPLHSSQEIVCDDRDGVVVKLRLKITFDFVMELLSRSNSLRVISPDSLRAKVCDICKKAIERNQ